MNDIVEIMPQLFLIYSEKGFKILCNKLNCIHQSHWPYDMGDKSYTYTIKQITSDENAFIYILHHETDDDGYDIFDNDGKPVMKKVANHRQHPIKYPFLLSYNASDEFNTYLFFIRYVDPEWKLKDIWILPDIEMT